MCGIFGYTGAPTNVSDLVFAGLKKLEYRGYDSWGIAVGSEGTIHLARDIGKLGAAPVGLPDSGVALGHTRWATTGAVTEANAHPHLDGSGRLAIVHNGVIENYVELRQGLLQRGHVFKSQTDSEVAAHLLEEELAKLDGQENALPEAVRQVSLMLHGLNAIAALDVQTGELAAVKNGSPLIVGLNGGSNYLSSDVAALLAHTNRVSYVRDGQVAYLRPDKVEVFDAATGIQEELIIEEIHWKAEEAELNGYHHYLEKEIWEQPNMLRRIAKEGREQAKGLAQFIKEAVDVHLVACGTAFHAAMAARYILATEARRVSYTTHAHEFGTFAPALAVGDAVIAFSQSGETIDVLDAIRAGRANGAKVGALVNVPGSTLSREADFKVMLGAGPEKSVLSTKTFTAKLAYVLLAAGYLADDPERYAAALLTAAAEIDEMRADGRLDKIRTVAHHIASRDNMFILGRGLGYPLALEAALKIKEVTYIHAEGFPAGELKHGVIALIEEGTPVIVFAPAGHDEAHMLISAGEVKARGAYIVGVGPEDHAVYDVHLPVHSCDMAYYISALAQAQCLAYELALLRGTDPDKPRNLAKSVTVR